MLTKEQIRSEYIAEPLYEYVCQDDVSEDYSERSEDENLSVLEYVLLYKSAEFSEWFNKNYEPRYLTKLFTP